MVNRKQLEDRILQIINYIDHDKMLKPLVWSIKLFQTEELLQLKNFLESWNYKPIYILLDKKIKEYWIILKEIKQIKISEKIKNYKDKEEKEKEKEKKNLENMLSFN